MTNEQLEIAFQQARTDWNHSNPMLNVSDEWLQRLARYFFFAGSTFGCEATSEIYDRTVGKVPEDIEGAAI